MSRVWVGCLAGFVLCVGVASAASMLTAFEVTVLPANLAAPTPEAVTSGSLDDHFQAFNYRELRSRGAAAWLRLRWNGAPQVAGAPSLTVRAGRQWQFDVFSRHESTTLHLAMATELPGYRGLHDLIYALPTGAQPGDSLYMQVSATGSGAEELVFTLAPLDLTLRRGAEEARMISGAFGALMAMAMAALLIWFVLPDRLFILYASLFSLQALYIAYLSGQGFSWPLLSVALPLGSHSWNVPAALSGAAACLFVREIADLRRFWPRIYNVLGGFAIAFVLLAFANVAKALGYGGWVSDVGNLMFIAAAVFTLTVAFMAWRKGNRAAGWFLVAWGLLETLTMATAASLLITDTEPALLYFGLPLSMVAAAILVALGTADRLRDQRRALSEAERNAQTDSLTGVLNRRSLLERLHTACQRAQTRNLPISLLFIDLDHFKQINDSYGHRAGDACLTAVIGPMQAELRQSDVIGRYGGEEFVVILSSADANAARGIAERILRRVAELRVEGFGAPIQLTCSIGVAASDLLGVWGEELIASADAAVYAAKSSGRNQVQIAPPLAA